MTVFGCSKKDDKPLDSIGSKYVRTDIIKHSELTAETYSVEALIILENHKKELKAMLPRMISDEIKIYKNTLIDIEKSPVKALSLQETNQLIKIEGITAGNRLMKKSIQLNQHYFKLFNELSILNIKYNINNEILFKDFYDAGPIVLSDEVLEKIDELIKDEKIRVEIESNNKMKGYAFTALNVVSAITGQTQNKEKLMNFTRGLKAAKNSIILQKSPSMLAKYTSKFLNKDLAAYIARMLNNQKLRDNVADKSAKIGASSSMLGGLKYIQTSQPLQSFKNIENKMNGRIGDYSDGILSVHMQNVRDIIKLNTAMIKENQSNNL
ncbi:hypothetical protein GCM10011518_44080 [Flavobacterium limi]|uniref:Uncharacterized protein n=2 Tax=Flavobacterium limi TaxID=2045105 RepID=A0ABQ1UY63_9FLAO|nr:hypothetical protein GCM10011518_44080 [Flavobacterium limi]